MCILVWVHSSLIRPGLRRATFPSGEGFRTLNDHLCENLGGGRIVTQKEAGEAGQPLLRFLNGIVSRVPEPGQEIPGLLHLGITEDLCGGSFLADDALIHVHHMVADVPGKGHFVSDHQHGHALPG